jgi:hypothetical protein
MYRQSQYDTRWHLCHDWTTNVSVSFDGFLSHIFKLLGFRCFPKAWIHTDLNMVSFSSTKTSNWCVHGFLVHWSVSSNGLDSQLMADRDLRALDMRHTLPNLKNLLLTLTDGEGAQLGYVHDA